MSIQYPQSIENLIKQFSKLPSVGRKTAERYVFYLLNQKTDQLRSWAKNINEVSAGLKFCQKCFNLSEKSPCQICSDNKRKENLICLVANPQDLVAIENTKQYEGKYFVLGGLINSIENFGPEKLNIKALIKEINSKLKNNQKIEIILALSPTIEGEATCLYLQKILKNPKIKISKLARGLSTGASLEYADENTLANALKFRRDI
ncbi:MAG: recombination mediator RecR [Patescibacteria group bacterium]|jgi:recombination protein RecR